MHKGKFYCFNPHYWVTEAWYWPGFVPWKLKAESLGVQPAPWSACDFSVLRVSEPLIATIDSKKATWWIDVSPPGDSAHLIVTAEKTFIGGDPWAVWKMTLDVPAHTNIMAVGVQEYPQYRVLVDTWSFCVPADPPPVGPLPLIKLTPPTWAESGSPYPALPQG
jgi:hypothetical protein